MRSFVFVALACLEVASAVASPSSFVPSTRVSAEGRFETVYRASQPIGGTVAEIGSSGLRLSGGKQSIAVSFAYLDRSGQRAVPPPVRATRLVENQAILDRGSVREWFVNGRDGLRQWFRVDERPGGALALGDLRLGLRVSGGLVTATERGVQVRQGDAAFRYSGLRAWDASGRELPTRLTGAGTTIELRIDDAGARYPLTVDPLWTLSTELEPSSTYHFSERFGLALAASADTLVTSSRHFTDNGGTVHIFRRATDGGWSLEGEIDSPETNDFFGSDVALSGAYLAVSAPRNDPKDNTLGEIYLYRRDNTGTWNLEQTISPAVPHSAYGVDLEGDRLAIVAKDRFFTYRRQAGGVWALEADQAVPNLGSNLDLDGDRLALATPTSDKAFLYQWNGSQWALQHTFEPGIPVSSGGGAAYYGFDLALRGNTFVATCPYFREGSDYVGRVFAYTLDGGNWTETVLGPPADTNPREFGRSVDLSDGELVVGIHSYPNDLMEGAAIYYQRTGGSWQPVQLLTAGAINYGDSVGITDHYIAITAPTFGTGYPVFVYSRNRVTPTFPLKARVGGKTVPLTLTLTQPAPAGGTVVSLSSNSPALIVPASATIPEGQTSVTVTTNTVPVVSDTLATVTASASEFASGTTTLLVKVPRIVSLTFSKFAIHGGEETVGTVSLNGPAPAGGVALSLAGSDPALFLPPTLFIAEGEGKVTFNAQGGDVGADTPVTVTTVGGGISLSTMVTVQAGRVPGLYVVYPSLNIGWATQVYVSIPPAPKGGVTIPITLEGPLFGDAEVKFSEGQTLKGFTIFADSKNAGLGKVSVTYNGLTNTKVVPVVKSILLSVEVLPGTVKGGDMVEVRVTIEKPAPAGGTNIYLKTATPDLITLPGILTVGSGSKTASVLVPTAAVSKSTKVAVLGNVQAGGLKGAYVTLTP